jgi:hypothetical protein
MSQVKTIGEAISVLVQVAELAQSRGVLSFEDAVITKTAIDYLKSISTNSEKISSVEEEEEVLEKTK